MHPDRRARGSTVREFRRARHLTLLELAKSTGMSKSHLGNIETGRFPTSEQHTIRIAAALDVPVEALTGQVPAIASLRTVLDLQADDLAAAANITPERLARIERGTERPHPDELTLIARRLGATVEALALDVPPVVSA